MGDVNRYI